MNNRVGSLALCLALALPFIEVRADPSTLDPAWGSGGTVAVSVGRVVTRVAAQSDGSTIAIVENSSLVATEGAQAFIVRLTPTGQVDPHFASGGISFACRVDTATCAPRVATESAVLDAMVDRGWVIEGDGHTRVFACTAAQ